jgi:large subunit ribosomal protein L30
LQFLYTRWTYSLDVIDADNYKNIIMKKIRITLVKSPIDRPERQKLTLQALGLNKLNATKEVEATPQILGMVRKVEHMISVEEVA